MVKNAHKEISRGCVSILVSRLLFDHFTGSQNSGSTFFFQGSLSLLLCRGWEQEAAWLPSLCALRGSRGELLVDIREK